MLLVPILIFYYIEYAWEVKAFLGIGRKFFSPQGIAASPAPEYVQTATRLRRRRHGPIQPEKGDGTSGYGRGSDIGSQPFNRDSWQQPQEG